MNQALGRLSLLSWLRRPLASSCAAGDSHSSSRTPVGWVRPRRQGCLRGGRGTIFFNPAGLTYLPGKQAVIAGSAINVESSFSGTARHDPLADTARNQRWRQCRRLGFVPRRYVSGSDWGPVG